MVADRLTSSEITLVADRQMIYEGYFVKTVPDRHPHPHPDPDPDPDPDPVMCVMISEGRP
jgi:hypothetical protein